MDDVLKRTFTTIKVFVILAITILAVFGVALLFGKPKVKINTQLGVVTQSPQELCGATSCYDLASQGIDINQWQLILSVIQEAEKQGKIAKFEGIQTGELLKEKVIALDDIVSDQAKALPINNVSDHGDLLGATEIT